MLGRLLDRLRAAPRTRPHDGHRDRGPRRVARRTWGDDPRAVRLRLDAGGAVDLSAGRDPPRRVDAPVGHADILPTMLDLLGAREPRPTSTAGLAGRSRRRPGAKSYFEALDANAHPRLGAADGHRVRATGSTSTCRCPSCTTSRTDPREARNIVTEDRGDEPRGAGTRALREMSGAADRAAATAVALDADGGAPAAFARLRWRAPRRPPAGTSDYTADDDPKRLVALNERFNAALEAFNAGTAGEALAGFRALLRSVRIS